jgi:hypothetical protein
VAPRYKKASKRIKTIILNHYCEVTEYHRNHAIRKLNHCLDKKPKRKPGRPSVYRQTLPGNQKRDTHLSPHLASGIFCSLQRVQNYV